VDKFCPLDAESQNLINTAMLKLGISARGYHRILKLARSIADLDKSDQIQQLQLAQAIQLRNLDRW
jgi:magnesium chelatase family protein